MTDRRKETPPIIGRSPVAAFPAVGGEADGPMTEKQAVILRDLAERAGEEFDTSLTEGQAEERIAALREQLGED
jgi:hypothetical protein